MFFLTLSRIIKFSFQNFARNIWLSLVTITIIVLTLFSVTMLVLVNAVMDEAIGLVKDKVDVSVYFKPSASGEQVLAVQSGLQSLEYVKSVKYVSKAEALDSLRRQYNDSPLILEALKELDNNPLGDTLVVSTYETTDYQNVIDILNATPQYAVLIDSKSFKDNRFLIERLESLSRQITTFGWGVTLFFALIAILVIVNTIRIAIYTHRDEITIMKLVGASNAFVRGPFVGEALIYAFAGVTVTVALTYAAANIGEPSIVNILGTPNFSLIGYLNQNFMNIFGAELLGIIVIATISTYVALRRYLRV